jgi:hypothetical protein
MLVWVEKTAIWEVGGCAFHLQKREEPDRRPFLKIKKSTTEDISEAENELYVPTLSLK